MATKKKTAGRRSARRSDHAGKKTRSAAATASSSSLEATPIVAIGASAGGLQALEEFFSQIPQNKDMCFVVITHQKSDHTSLLPELLGRHTRMEVQIAKEGQHLEPNHVYLSPPGKRMALHNRILKLLAADEGANPLPIDFFFRSLAEDQKAKAIGIILSGTGTDGTLGLKAIKGEAGMTMVQNLDSARYTGMPGSAISSGLVDFVLRPSEMAQKLVAYADGPHLKDLISEAKPVAERVETATTDFTSPLQEILQLLHKRSGHDFSDYKANTLRRRIQRRMNLHEIADPKKYLFLMEENPQEIELLVKELLINVTQFFRDPVAYETLRQRILSNFLASLPEGHTFRVWVPACATGEEVYSLAILVKECMLERKRALAMQFFATDIDDACIVSARKGEYAEGIEADVTPQRLKRYFIKRGDKYSISKEIREMVVFASHDLIKNAPFTKLDFLSCRNTLIYFAQAGRTPFPRPLRECDRIRGDVHRARQEMENLSPL